eukprot:CAMPEP_0195630792 /NCGR_PEP_ID=MMETSP0815-20121206/20734_1 /TAXON_ID=97485 /ORGANISM="Prymnesium parvum, Strain Texoma1" /LENGTH=146 /DNA_ID=CAMNT_0040772277 /DNA_START=38 /DNA_END=479 /DNA_ORIENTATION=+
MAVPAVQITTPQSLLNGTYEPRASSDIPQAFRTFCAMMAWEAEHMWVSWTTEHGVWYELARDDGMGSRTYVGIMDTDHGVWYELANGAFLYWNATTLQWWIVGPSGISEYHGTGDCDDVTSVTEWTSITGKPVSITISVTDKASRE